MARRCGMVSSIGTSSSRQISTEGVLVGAVAPGPVLLARQYRMIRLDPAPGTLTEPSAGCRRKPGCIRPCVNPCTT